MELSSLPPFVIDNYSFLIGKKLFRTYPCRVRGTLKLPKHQAALDVTNGILANLSPGIYKFGFAVLTIENSNALLSIDGSFGDVRVVGNIQVTLPF